MGKVNLLLFRLRPNLQKYQLTNIFNYFLPEKRNTRKRHPHVFLCTRVPFYFRKLPVSPIPFRPVCSFHSFGSVSLLHLCRSLASFHSFGSILPLHARLIPFLHSGHQAGFCSETPAFPIQALAVAQLPLLSVGKPVSAIWVYHGAILQPEWFVQLFPLLIPQLIHVPIFKNQVFLQPALRPGLPLLLGAGWQRNNYQHKRHPK